MSKSAKIWLIIASVLVVLGLAVFAGVMFAYDWDFTKLSTEKYEANTLDINEEFKNISLDTDTADILFSLSENDRCYVECYEEENANHSATVREDTLVIDVINERSWYDYIGINFDTPRMTVYLPKTEYASLSIKGSTGDIEIPKDFAFDAVDISLSTGDVDFEASASEAVKIKASTGDICAENISASLLDLAVSTGRVTVSGVSCEGDIIIGVTTGDAILTNVACKSVISSGSTGDISLNHVIAAEKFSIERSTGDVKFDGSDAAEIFVKTNTGDVTGSLLTDKLFITQTNTGDIDVPKAITGGKCEITTNTGDIGLTMEK